MKRNRLESKSPEKSYRSLTPIDQRTPRAEKDEDKPVPPVSISKYIESSSSGKEEEVAKKGEDGFLEAG